MKRFKTVLAVAASSLLLSGCEFDVYKLPLPGGPDVGSNPITIQVEFRDVMDLVPKSTVKVNDVSVGQVTDISLDGYIADVTLELRADTELPDNAVAEIRQTSLLGEKFVSLSAPASGATGELADGDVIPVSATGRNPEVEEVLGALSLLLNGGGVAQLKTIAQELNIALEGREDSAKSVLNQIRIFVTQLDEGKADIVDAIDSLNRLAIAVQTQQGTIDAALEELPSALVSIDKQRADLVKMLRALNDLSGVGTRVIRESKDATIETFRQLQPVLSELAATGDDFAKSFNVFLTYPFVDEVVGRDPQVARNLHMGDYTNLSVTMIIDATGDGGGGGGGSEPPLPTLPTILDPTIVLDNVAKCLQSGSLDSAACKKVLTNAEDLAQLKQECKKPKNKNKAVCEELNQLPDLPFSLTNGKNGNNRLPGLPLPLPRAGFGPTDKWETHGPTMGQMMKLFDPALVTLLVPGMVIR
ncbi:MCE family protein [Nocardioides sp.]|uniref:MCE family protein n=1 Tax=Nocardioides sp. TaxID=35761 RepID=UPI003564D1FB